MEEETNGVEPKKKRGLSFIIVAVVIGLFIIAGGVATAFFFTGGSPKDQYLKAEVDTYNFIKDKVSERFENQIKWSELADEHPIKTTIKTSAEFNDPMAFGGYSEIEEIINQSTATITAELDRENKELLFDAEIDIMSMAFDDIKFLISENTLLVDLPFLPDTLEISGDDWGKLMYELDPITYDGEESINFEYLFESGFSFLTEEDVQYLSDKYGTFIYELLPDSAFSNEKDTITVHGEEMKVEKITMELSDDELKDFIRSILEEIQNDERLHEIIENYYVHDIFPDPEVRTVIDEFEENVAELIDSLDDTTGEKIEQSVWVNSDGLIVERELKFSYEDFFDDEVTLEISSSKLLEDTEQKVTYELEIEDEYDPLSLVIDLHLIDDDGEIDDQLEVAFDDDLTLKYRGKEKKDEDTHTFNRTLAIEDLFDTVTFYWDGDAKMDDERTTTKHEVQIGTEDVDPDMLTLYLDIDEEIVKEVSSYDPGKTKNIGEMDEFELFEYFTEDVEEHFTEWMIDNFGDFLYMY